MSAPHHDPRAEPFEDDLAPLGPPAWSAYVTARRRYFTNVAIQGLERALDAPAARERPGRVARERGR
ncbi:hypothetical protein [Miltoncostaea marina]|uniref:hypothetical protein n=1 Tax=Miltoncostaea marina TaxID=2843215 RepID=UPI001C3CF64D|nr:hypothetical protein [Miltoncostaea marina]